MSVLYHSKGYVHCAKASDVLMWAICKPQIRFKMCAFIYILDLDRNSLEYVIKAEVFHSLNL